MSISTNSPFKAAAAALMSARNKPALICIAVLFLLGLSFRALHSPSFLPSFHIAENGNTESIAYATFLAGRHTNDSEPDPYFTSCRVLAYQLLHQPTTRTRRNTPLLVLVTPFVSEAKRSMLEAEGATVVPVDFIESNNAHPDARWLDIYAKLHVFRLTTYSRILYVDSDMLLTRSLDGIWDEEVSRTPQTTRTQHKGDVKADEPPLPEQYLFAGIADNGGADHPFPPPAGTYLNGGFFLAAPSQQLFDYYTGVMNIADRYPLGMMEQDLLNYAHRRDGPMPWRTFEPGVWNSNWPSRKDWEGGAATLHDKFWDAGNAGWIDRRLVEMWWRAQGQMEGYWQRKEEKAGRHGLGLWND